jgi:4-amino-4-deoxy-L-arabinose transferase-like glycosyltransferase
MRGRLDRFWRVLLAIAAVALAVRVGYVVVAKDGPCRDASGAVVHEGECLDVDGRANDQLYYHTVAQRLAEGDGFVEPFDPRRLPAPGTDPDAEHPPLTVVVLAGVSLVADVPPLSWVGDASHVNQHRLVLSLLGTLVVVLVGLLGRRVGGERVGWIAAAVAAVYPFLWVNDGIIMSETVTNVTVVATLLAALRFARAPGLGGAALLGALGGLAALARAELVLLAPLLVVPIALTRRGLPARHRLGRAAATVAVAALVLAPWVGYNLARFDEPTFVSTNDGVALAGSNCDAVYSGGGIGLTFLAPPCLVEPIPPGDASARSDVYRDRALDYVRDHLRRVPLVAAARVGRTWSLFRPADMIEWNRGEAREAWVTRLGLVAYYPLLLAAVVGAVALGRAGRRADLWALVVPAIVVTLGSALTYGQTRFRAAAEPSLVVLAAVAVATFTAQARRAAAPPDGAPPR